MIGMTNCILPTKYTVPTKSMVIVVNKSKFFSVKLESHELGLIHKSNSTIFLYSDLLHKV